MPDKSEARNVLVIVASEVIEHLDDQSNFWRVVEAINARFASTRRGVAVEVYCTLPVGEKIPSHTVEFLDAEAAFLYLSGHVVVQKKWFLRPPQGITPSPYLEECVCVLGKAAPSALSDSNFAELERIRSDSGRDT